MAVILPSVYKDGTATVAANGVAVTGQGTMWLNTVLPGDFFGTHKGSPNRILAVNSNTSLTLAYPWLGGAQATAAYEIMYQSDNARMLEAARQLLEKLSNGNVDALAGLVGGADKLPYFNGLGTMAQADLTAYGRSIIASTTSEGFLPGRLKEQAELATNANLNVNSGFYRCNGSTTSTPVTDVGYLLVIRFDANACLQLYYRWSNNQVWRRNMVSGAFGAWAEQVQQSFTSIEQAGGTGQAAGTKINIGWDAAVGGLRAMAGGNLDLGKIWTDYVAPSNHNSGGGSGWYKLPNGFIFQYGFILGASGAADQAITFPTGFPSGFRGATCTPSGDSSLNGWVCTYDNVSNSGMTIRRRNVANGGAVSAPYPSFVTAWSAWGT